MLFTETSGPFYNRLTTRNVSNCHIVSLSSPAFSKEMKQKLLLEMVGQTVDNISLTLFLVASCIGSSSDIKPR